jgi:hypothetical protein
MVFAERLVWGKAGPGGGPAADVIGETAINEQTLSRCVRLEDKGRGQELMPLVRAAELPCRDVARLPVNEADQPFVGFSSASLQLEQKTCDFTQCT